MEILTENNSRALVAWRSLSLARAICALVGWLLIALQPHANFTLEKLQKLMVYSYIRALMLWERLVERESDELIRIRPIHHLMRPTFPQVLSDDLW